MRFWRVPARFGVLVALLVATAAPAQLGGKGFGLPTGKPAARATSQPTESSDVVKASLSAAASTVAPGGELALAITLVIEPGWHVWVHETQARALPDTAVFDGAIFTTLSMAPADAPLRVLGVQWPSPHAVKADIGDGPRDYAVYEGTVTIFAKVGVSNDANGEAKATLGLNLQACNAATCLPSADIELPVVLAVKPGAAPTPPPSAFAGYDPSKLVAATDAAPIAEADDGSIHFDFFGAEFRIDPRGAGLAL
ncbi:MAG: protein-disulfide reductase DsbD domain-containing protein, partial [Planctomycetota bacterium]